MVTVVGYGSGSKIGTTIGSVTKVKGEELENRPVANVGDALQGKVAGLTVMTSSGEPSANSTISLHGSGSLAAGTTPLIILDGAPVSSSILVTINPNDIESYNILKDASATSIYGSRAANGVIYIATKRGRHDSKPVIDLRAQYGISQPATGKYEVMNSSELAGYLLEVGAIGQDRHDEIMAAGINTNWRDYYYKSSAPTYQVDLSITGGSEKTAYYLAGSYMNQEGTAPGSSMERYTFRSNLDVRAASWIKLGANLTMGFDRSSRAQTMSNNVYNAAFMSLLSLPYESPYDEDGNEKPMISGHYNPNYIIKKHPSRGNRLQVSGNAYVQITPVRNLNIKSQLGVDGFAYWSEAFGLASYLGSLGSGSVSRAHQNSGSFTITNTIDYNFEFANPDHKLYLLAGQEGIRDDALTFTVSRSGQIRDDLMTLSNGVGTPTVSDALTTSVFNSYFGRVEYGYAGKYNFDASVRRDVSSRFGKKNREGIFYAVGAMWDLKKENFLADSRVVSDLSLKVSYGTQGNAAITDNAYLAAMTTYTYGDKNGLVIASVGDENLGWETQELFSVSANVRLLDIISFEAQFYNRATGDMLMDVPLPGTSGFQSRPRNVGSMVNRGIDLTLNVDIFRNKDWYVGFNATFNYNHNKITKLFNGLEEYALSRAGICYAIGHDSYEFYLPKYMGVNTDTGAPQWETVNAETGERGLTEEFGNASLQFTGKSAAAPYTGGFGVNARWKGISLAANFSWTYDRWMVNNAMVYLENPGYTGLYNRSKRLLDMWRKPGDKTNVPAFGYATQFDTNILEDASFLRLKNLSLAYDFPKKLIRKSGFMEGLRVYFIARNLLTFTGYTGYDPEVDTNMALGDYPNTREFVGGIQITF